MQFEHTDNGQKGEFFLEDAQGKRIAEISYLWSDEGKIIADHTWVDDSLRGQGMARKLLDQLVGFAREKQHAVGHAETQALAEFRAPHREQE